MFDQLTVPVVPFSGYESLNEHADFRLFIGNDDVKAFTVKPGDMYVIEKIPKPVNIIDEHRAEVVEMLHIHPRYEDLVRTYFDQLREDFSGGGEAGVVFVGVNVRITDAGECLYLADDVIFLMQQAKKMLLDGYVSDKSGWYSTYTGKMLCQNVVLPIAVKMVFVVASDHPDWAKSNVQHEGWNIAYTSDYHTVIGGESKEFFDFSVLSRTNHSVNNSPGGCVPIAIRTGMS